VAAVVRFAGRLAVVDVTGSMGNFLNYAP